ncbi:hypothetical protein [Brevibacillus nitrificans]|uniref:hypothetical protein n=1 Tax=Brevibacillus nitrificans TaxID=651560 RepID=UPI0028659150|nr:hypothetical protein [Brevibacillus nitrificans]MDR7315436.1 hypothetical protein [Brevibacillus nitrificans]
MDQYLFEDYAGEALGIASADEISGALTINSGILQFEPDGESFFHINLRYPVTDEASRILGAIAERVGKYGFAIEPPLFPGKTSLAHQADEYIEVEDLLLPAAMYARAIYELANADFHEEK